MKTQAMVKGFGIALIAGIVSLTSIAMAQSAECKDHNGGRHRGGAGKALEKLDLTDQQKEQVKALRDQFQADHAATFEELKTLRKQGAEQMKNGDKAGAEATRAKAKELMEGMKADKEALKQKIDAILTTEQKAELEKMREDRRGKMKEHKRERLQERKERGTIN